MLGRLLNGAHMIEPEKCEQCGRFWDEFCRDTKHCPRSDCAWEQISTYQAPVPPPNDLGSSTSDGSSADYYVLPPNAKELQDLISFRNMNGQMAEIFRAVYRTGYVSHSSKLRDAKKIKFYIDAEIERLLRYESAGPVTQDTPQRVPSMARKTRLREPDA